MSVRDLIENIRGSSPLVNAIDAAHGRGNAQAMSHAWLLVSPSSDGRKRCARHFAAALMCPHGGCGQCGICKTVLVGAHPDVTIVTTHTLSTGVAQVRELVSKSSMAPTVGAYQIILIEDGEKMTDQAADALLKSLEEPPATTVWILCAPSSEDMIVTVRSRSRIVRLGLTPVGELTTRLVSEGIDQDTADLAAHISQGDYDKAICFARDEYMRSFRDRICAIPPQLDDLSSAITYAASLMEMADDYAAHMTDDDAKREMDEMKKTLGHGMKGVKSTQKNSVKSLEDEHKLRLKRAQRDALDQICDLLSSWYRDVMICQLAGGESYGWRPVNIDCMDAIVHQANTSRVEWTLGYLDALDRFHTDLITNVTPTLAMERLMVSLARLV